MRQSGYFNHHPTTNSVYTARQSALSANHNQTCLQCNQCSIPRVNVTCPASCSTNCVPHGRNPVAEHRVLAPCQLEPSVTLSRSVGAVGAGITSTVGSTPQRTIATGSSGGCPLFCRQSRATPAAGCTGCRCRRQPLEAPSCCSRAAPTAAPAAPAVQRQPLPPSGPPPTSPTPCATARAPPRSPPPSPAGGCRRGWTATRQSAARWWP